MSHPRPPTPPQPHPEPPPIPGAKWIPLHRMVGSSRRPRYAVVAYTLVDEEDYAQQSPHRWSGHWDPDTGSYYARRFEKVAGKLVTIYLHREVLGLARNPGRGSNDLTHHKNHDTLDNRKSNLESVTHHQNSAHQRRQVNANPDLPRGVSPNGKKYHVQFRHHGKYYCLPSVSSKWWAALMYNHAVTLLHKEFAFIDPIPPEHTPTPEEQRKLKIITEAKMQKDGLTW